MRRLAAMGGLLGTALLLFIGVLDHIIGLNSNFYYIAVFICCLMMLPMLIKEALALKEDADRKKYGKDNK